MGYRFCSKVPVLALRWNDITNQKFSIIVSTAILVRSKIISIVEDNITPFEC